MYARSYMDARSPAVVAMSGEADRGTPPEGLGIVKSSGRGQGEPAVGIAERICMRRGRGKGGKGGILFRGVGWKAGLLRNML